ncbi:MAG: lytic transglycosylase domain-containing protein [bacterium]|nr:lytic transglycosylase domain-containing protein [bacterium]
MADEGWLETRGGENGKEAVFTNQGQRNFNRDFSTSGGTLKNNYPRRPAPAPKPAASAKSSPSSKPAAKSSPAKSVSSSVSGTPSGSARIKVSGDTLVYDQSVLPPPTFRRVTVFRGGDWAFATFDPKKRTPRPVSYYGYTYNAAGEREYGWIEADLNDIILKHARERGVDPLLIEIIIRYESNFNPDAVSPVGASGLMQLMPDTAQALGVSDVFNPDQNVAGGTHYISIQLENFHSVPLALAAYNAGPQAVMKYGGIPPYSETQYYVNAIYQDYLAGKRRRESGK